MNKRQIKILELLNDDKRIEVSLLAKLCDVSTVTMRKDLDYLEKQELLVRKHGYAEVNNSDNINYRLSIDYSDKLEIALKACESISPNETVIIESGSTCALLAVEIAKRDQNNTIITNSSFIARYLKDYPNTKVILLAGVYQSSSEAIVGQYVELLLKKFNVQKFFIGTDGISKNYGISGLDLDRAETVKIMSKYSERIYVLSQSKKIGKYESYSMFKLSEVFHVFTNKIITNEQRDLLIENNVSFS